MFLSLLLMYGKEVVKVCHDEVEGFLARDPQAFEELINQYKAYVFAIILRFINDPDDAQDIAQEVFLQLYRSLPEYQPDHLKAWIGRITTNKAIDWKRKQARQPALVDSDMERQIIPGVMDMSPEQMLLQQERESHMKDLCRSLPPRYSQVMIKYHFENKSYQQIAREEGISLKTVESRLYRARRLLRERWKEGAE
ncbi:MAG TPA: RNA polymerase subunit sigma-24 [Syntrophomonas sp.]|jgi:RNA polymerase sigma factor (sigma-70 family)|nr:RNA polymerase subunit sigma-24 [Syntrophomonas sp.]